MTLIPQPTPGGDPTYNDLCQRSHALSTYNLKFRKLHTWELEDIPDKLYHLYMEAPELTEEHKKPLLEQLNIWLPEIKWLTKNLDLMNKQKWFDELDQIKSQ